MRNTSGETYAGVGQTVPKIASQARAAVRNQLEERFGVRKAVPPSAAYCSHQTHANRTRGLTLPNSRRAGYESRQRAVQHVCSR